MDTTFRPDGATVYEFPRKARAPASGLPNGQHAVVAFPLRRCAPVEFGNAWYHEAAVQDADQAGKR